MISLLLLLGLVAANESFHSRLHADASAKHGVCAVCALAKGQVDAASSAAPRVAVAGSFSWVLPAFDSVRVQEADFSVASSRGPPASVSSL